LYLFQGVEQEKSTLYGMANVIKTGEEDLVVGRGRQNRGEEIPLPQRILKPDFVEHPLAVWLHGPLLGSSRRDLFRT